MRKPRGFGKKYFTLASIQAHASARVMHAQTTALTHYSAIRLHDESETPSAPPDEDSLELLTTESDQRSRPCHCNRYFKHRAKTLTKLAFLTQPSVCRCRKTKSGIAPPLMNFFSYFLFY